MLKIRRSQSERRYAGGMLRYWLILSEADDVRRAEIERVGQLEKECNNWRSMSQMGPLSDDHMAEDALWGAYCFVCYKVIAEGLQDEVADAYFTHTHNRLWHIMWNNELGNPITRDDMEWLVRTIANNGLHLVDEVKTIQDDLYSLETELIIKSF